MQIVAAPARLGRLRKSRTGAVQDALVAWYRANARDLPWRRTRDPYAIVVSELMLQQQTVRHVTPVCCCSISSETTIAYGARVRRQGRSRAVARYQAT